MSTHDQAARPYARFVRRLAAAGILLGVCCATGCEDKPAPATDQPAASAAANPEAPGAAKHKRTPRRPK